MGMSDTDQPLVSIVMPVYNAMPYLDEAIRSIYAQTYEVWELIIVDDASTDGSREFVNRISDHRVRVFRNEKNMGHSFTCNKGVILARGEFVAKMDADDICFPERLERQLGYLLDNRNIDVVGCGLYRVDKNMNIITLNMPPKRHEDIVRFISISRKFIFGPSFLITDGCLMAKKGWFERWKYDPDIPYAQDFDLILRSHYSSIFANISEPLYVYRRVGVTSSWFSQTKAVYYKAVSLLKYGFKKSNIGLSCMAIFSLIARPIFAYLTILYVFYVKKKTEYTQDTGEIRLADNEKKLQNVLKIINQVQIPKQL